MIGNRGMELADNKQFTSATGVGVYFSDPRASSTSSTVCHGPISKVDAVWHGSAFSPSR